jgi:1,4-dihydroxy-2-naphthoate octaprenyltransferase
MSVWLTLARPRMLPLLWLAVFFGFMLGHWEAGVHLRGAPAFAIVLVAWTFLHLGTMWLNAARDRDEGPVMFGATAKVPENASMLGYAALLVCALLATAGGPIIVGCAVTAVILSVLYSHPRIALKAHPAGGPAINMVGYGLLTPIAGLAAAHGGVSIRTVFVLIVCALAMGGLSFAAQAFQQEEDQERGDRTLVATHGPATTLAAARGLIGLANVLALTGALLGWFPLACLVVLPLALHIDRYMRSWAKVPGGGTPAHASGLLKRLLFLLGTTVLAAIVQHVYDLFQGELPAGLNTRVVPEVWLTLW